MRILVVGSGGREHAIAWRLARDTGTEVYVCPGNAGMTKVAKIETISGVDVAGIATLALDLRVDLVVVGPENWLAAGLADRLRAEGILVLGPSQAGARMEASKAFAKEVMAQARIPTAAHAAFTEPEEAKEYIRTHPDALVIKADGLCAGKGVAVADSQAEALKAVDDLTSRYGPELIVEERLEGREVSLLGLTDGERVLPFPAARDHKRVFDGDQGPNTGGMGAVAPVADVPPEEVRRLCQQVLEPVIACLRERGILYRGVIYAGMMLTRSGPIVLEFNVRFGDPETQSILPLVAGNLSELMTAAAAGDLGRMEMPWVPAAAVTVVLASGGYPGPCVTGKLISGLEEAEALGEVSIFHAGTRLEGGKLVTAGGRVLGVTAVGDSSAAAISLAYRAAGMIQFEGVHFRRDIGATSG